VTTPLRPEEIVKVRSGDAMKQPQRLRIPRLARRWGRVAGGGFVLWAGVVLFGGTTVLLLAVLSRHWDHGEFSSLSTLLGLAFACSLVPAGVQMRCAALAADGQPLPKMARGWSALLTLLALSLSPLLGAALHLPTVAVGFIVLQVVAGIALARMQGAMLGAHRFSALGVNQALEGVARAGLGIFLGITWGLDGLALAMFASTVVAIVTLPPRPAMATTYERPATSLFHSSIALALLGVFVQLDLLVVPSAFTSAQANQYDLAAVPSKSVYLVLAALGPILFPFVRRHGSRKLIIGGPAATLAVGLVASLAVVLLRPVIAAVLGQQEATVENMVLLCVAMSLAGTTATIVNSAIARGVVRPWPPTACGMVALVVCSRLEGVTSFAISTVVIQLMVALASLAIVIRDKPGKPERSTLVIWALQHFPGARVATRPAFASRKSD
jgi:hypothetical protein